MQIIRRDPIPAWLRRSWARIRKVVDWVNTTVLLKHQVIEIGVAARQLRGLRVAAGVLCGFAAVIGGIGWLNWRVARARALNLLIQRPEARGVIAVKAYERGRAQIRDVMNRVENDPSVPPDEKVRAKGDLAVLMIWLIGREQASMRAIQAAHDARLAIPKSVSGSTPIADPISGQRFPLEATKAEMVGPMVKALQEGEQVKAFLGMVAAYSRPGAPAIPTQTEAIATGMRPQGGIQ